MSTNRDSLERFLAGLDEHGAAFFAELPPEERQLVVTCQVARGLAAVLVELDALRRVVEDIRVQMP